MSKTVWVKNNGKWKRVIADNNEAWAPFTDPHHEREILATSGEDEIGNLYGGMNEQEINGGFLLFQQENELFDQETGC
jgi:hypothetical protein